MRALLRLEALEERALPSVSAVLNGTVLNLTSTPNTSDTVLIRPTANTPGSVDAVLDGVTSTFAGVTQVNYTSNGAQGDTFTNRTTLPGTISVNNGNNVVYTIAPKSVVTAGNGNNILQVTGGGSTITAGNGNNNVYGGPGDVITVGNGTNVVYDILPGNQVINVGQHNGIDHVFGGPQTTFNGLQPQDHTAQFFVAAPLGSGTLALSGSTLYFAANNNGDTFTAFEVGTTIQVVYNLNDGTGFKSASFQKSQVNQFAVFGGTGNDVFINDTSVDDAMYGAGGANVLFGGHGAFSLLKAGGNAAGGSVAIGNSPVYNDLNGSGLTNQSTVLIFNQPGATNIARSNSPTDVVFGNVSFLVTLYPDFAIASLLPPFVPA